MPGATLPPASFPFPLSTFRYPIRCAALLGLCLPCAAVAQTTATPADTATTYKHHLGLTASPVLDGFFRNNRSLPLGLLYKRQLTPAKALRLRLVGLFSQADTASSIDAPGTFTQGYVTGPDRSHWLVQGFAGYEWQRPLSRRVGLAYGLEAGVGYERLRTEAAFLQGYPPGGLVTDTDERITQDWQVQLRPFVGFYYQPTPRLRLFAESVFVTSYIHRRWTHNGRSIFTNGEQDRFLNERAHANRFTANWRPVQLVGATISF